MFELSYLVDNGRSRGWESDTEAGCKLVQWRDDETYSVLDSTGKPIGYGDTSEDAIQHARLILTDRRRARDGVTTARIG